MNRWLFGLSFHVDTCIRQNRRYFFLNIDDDFGLPEAIGKPVILLAEFLVLYPQRIPGRFPFVPFSRAQGPDDYAAIALTSPSVEI